jgi:hypothetical protein
MKTTLNVFWTFLVLFCGTTAGVGQTNVFHSGNAKTDEEIRQYEVQAFVRDLPPQIQSVFLQRNLTSLDVWANGFQQTNLTEPEALGDLNLQVWLLRNDGTALSSIGKTILGRGWQQTFSIPGERDYKDSMLYSFIKVPVEGLAGVVIRAKGKLYCYQIDQKKWQK